MKKLPISFWLYKSFGGGYHWTVWIRNSKKQITGHGSKSLIQAFKNTWEEI